MKERSAWKFSSERVSEITQKGKGPVKSGQKPIRCYRYDGWVMDGENVQLWKT